jgi:predicted transglutaminase-like cysteine proteinase
VMSDVGGQPRLLSAVFLTRGDRTPEPTLSPSSAVFSRPPALADYFATPTPALGDAFVRGAPTDQAQPDTGPLKFDEALLAKLDAANRRINTGFIGRSDAVTFGDSEYWHMPIMDGTGVGDCKDFVLEKRSALIADGIPARDLSIAIVLTHRGEGHAVLLVSTDKGEYVLDNLSPWVIPWRAVNYHWLKRQMPGEPLSWVSIASAG